MNVKRLLRTLIVAVLISITVPATSGPAPIVTNYPGKDVPAAVQPLLNRLQEIKDIDKSSLTRSEKKELRKEIKAINSEVRANKNGIYLSIGAAIIVILLLILLL